MAFTSTWSTISSAQTDADSPLDITLMEGIRQNLIHIYEWLGQGFTPSTAHNHDGVNSRTITLAANSVNSSAYIANSITSTKLGTTSVELAHLKLTTSFLDVTSNSANPTYFATNNYVHNYYLNVAPGNTTNYCHVEIMSALDGSSSTGFRYVAKIIHLEPSSGVAQGFKGTVYWNYHSS